MTLLGKVFTVLIFIMSLVFMTFAVAVSATHTNWRTLVTNPPEKTPEDGPLGLVHQLAQLKQANVNLRAEMEELRNEYQREMTARRHAIGTLETKLAEVKQSLTDKEAALRLLQASEGEAAEALTVAQKTVASLRIEIGSLRSEIQVAQADRDKQFDRVVQLTDQYNSVQGFLKNFTERNLQLASQISDYKRVMDKVGLTPNTDVEGMPPPDLDGIVTAVGERNLIEISLGSDDGLRVGHRLQVFRSNAYLGYAVVLKTDPDRAVAQVDEKTQRGLVKVRDSVATKLSRTRAS